MIDAEFSLASQYLRTKCFVDFEAIDLIEAQTAVIEKGADGRDRADAHIFRGYTDSSACHNTGQRLFAMLARERSGGNQSRASPVHDGGTVAAGLHTAERWPDFGQDFKR
jgi:hypothetical protein